MTLMPMAMFFPPPPLGGQTDQSTKQVTLSSQPLLTLASYGGLSKNRQHRLMCLYAWSLAG